MMIARDKVVGKTTADAGEERRGQVRGEDSATLRVGRWLWRSPVVSGESPPFTPGAPVSSGSRAGRVGADRSPVFGPISPGARLLRVLCARPGRGRVRARGLCQRLGLLPSTPWAQLTPGQRAVVEAEARGLPGTGEALVRAHRERRRVRRATQGIRAIRRRRGLPVRGQRTKTNARTARRLNPGRLQRFV